ncbi:MAG: tetratricopeptide repeat protein, partial [Elusimicrobia bacterium]|nr:tetratricopeptide repeat protein [Elusimicrobiota bacterium]
RRAPLLSAGLLWIPAALVPVSGIVVMRNLTADRYLYFASAGVCLALSALAAAPFGRTPRARRAALILCGAVAAAWIELGQLRLPVFRSDEAYFAATVAADPDVPRARCNLGLAEWRDGNLDAAENDLRAAQRLWPESRRVREDLAALLQSRGRADQARALLDAAP